jgi:antitoxin CptB
MIGAARGLVSSYNEPMDTDAEFNRLCWHSRRGMLELDLVLEPFVKQRYRQLEAVDRARYQRLLECEDQDLFAWFLRRDTPEDQELAIIVEQIIEYTQRGA